MPEIIWKAGAENDLLQIFTELEEHSKGVGVRFVGKLDFTLANLQAHPEMAPCHRFDRLWLVLFP
jgi:plasmid stabilization system protein ParE